MIVQVPNTKSEKKRSMRRTLQGTIVNLPGSQTAIVEVEEAKQHPKYKKRYRQTKRFHAHIGKAEVKVGQKVSLVEARPRSARKRWSIRVKS